MKIVKEIGRTEIERQGVKIQILTIMAKRENVK